MVGVLVSELAIYQKANDQQFMQMQTAWAAEINPVLALPIVQGFLLSNIALINGETTINHLLGRKMIGWIIVDIDTGAAVYRSKPYNDKTLTLTSGASCTVSLWVF